MRNVINISLPKELASFVRKEAKQGKFASVSEFIRALIRDYEETKLLADIEKGREEYRQGKSKVLQSLKDLR